MIFAFLHRPPDIDTLNVSLADIDEMDEGLALKLFEKLGEARERTYNARRGGGK